MGIYVSGVGPQEPEVGSKSGTFSHNPTNVIGYSYMFSYTVFRIRIVLGITCCFRLKDQVKTTASH